MTTLIALALAMICYLDLNDGHLHYAGRPGDGSAPSNVMCRLGFGSKEIGRRICMERAEEPGAGVGVCYDERGNYWRPVDDGPCGATPYRQEDIVS